jgi:heme/copper-type cytochrome/quinol oxidase subunit 2
MKTIILIIYWIVAVISTYIVRYRNVKKNHAEGVFANRPFWKKLKTHLSIVIIVPLAIPFILIYVAVTRIKKARYRNRPKPVDKKLRKFLKPDIVFDEDNRSISLSEYNLKHNTNYTLDQIYGKGYEASLNNESRDKNYGSVQ